MSKQVYISADYSGNDGDREVVDLLNNWGKDNLHKVDFIDMSKVSSGSVSEEPDCRFCDLKKEFNKQIKASSAVIFVVGDKTADRTAGSSCKRATLEKIFCSCTPYKQNTNGTKQCKIESTCSVTTNDIGNINSYSFIEHEFREAKKREKDIIVLYNSLRKESSWLPSYMKECENIARPFWIKNSNGEKIGDYNYIKEVLGYD